VVDCKPIKGLFTLLLGFIFMFVMVECNSAGVE
jgi:hypothetical protein